MATDLLRHKRIGRVAGRVSLLIGLALILYFAAYVFFKTQCGSHFVEQDPWVGGDSSMSMTFSGYWGTVDMASGEIVEQFRHVDHSFTPKWAGFLDALFYPAKQIDQKITGWQISFAGHNF